MTWFLRLFSTLRIVRLKPGDVLVLEYPHRLSPERYEALKRQTHRVFGDGVKIAVLEEGMTLHVVRRENVA